MSIYSPIAFVTLIALLQYGYMGFQVAKARGRFGVQAPSTQGHPEFERYFRAHMNTLEWLVIFLPSFWLAAFFTAEWGQWVIAVVTLIGALWILGRLLYMRGYVLNPEKRIFGFILQTLSCLLLMIIALLGAGFALFS